jgi:hypothetical protein
MLNRELKVIDGGSSPSEWATGHEVVRQEKGWKIRQFTLHGTSWVELTYSGNVSGVMDLVREALDDVPTSRPDVPTGHIWVPLTV